MPIFLQLAAMLAILLGSLMQAQAQSARLEHEPTGRKFKPNANAPAALTQQDSQAPIRYHGGGVLKGNPNVYLIWYGSHSASTKSLLTSLLSGLSGSPYLNINATYPQDDGRLSATTINVRSAVQDNYSLGRSLAETDVLTIVGSAITRNGWTPDQTGIYIVFTAADVRMPGFGSEYCGWHSKGRVNGTPVRFAFIGDPAHYSNACSVQPTVSPNNNPSADAMANILAHELVETITDPNLDAWYDDYGYENADKCAWQFGSVFTVGNGAIANMYVSGNYYLIQQNWVNFRGGYCGLVN